MSLLLSWLDSPSGERGIRFATPDGWQLWTYERLAHLAKACAVEVAAAGVPAGGRVAIVGETGPRFVGYLFGTMLAGAVPAPVAPGPAYGDHQRYDRYWDHVLNALRPDLVVDRAHPLPVAGKGDSGRPLADLALIQFTSGTTGHVRGVRVPHSALEANLRAIVGWLEMGGSDATASWLPVYHDMGLVGCLLAPVITGTDLWLMAPADFVRHPVSYLRCFGEQSAVLTAMPTFGLEHVLRRVGPEALGGLDFSRWRAVIVGAERVAAPTLRRFADLCAPNGFSPTALLPAYGLAEATLAVSGLPLRTGWRSVSRPDGTVVGCGSALPGAAVTVVDDRGRPVAEGVEGQIIVRGASVAAGYLDAPYSGAHLDTGDAGFLKDGQLYVLGRLGDSIKIRGKTLFAEDVEAAVRQACTAAPDRLATLLGMVGEQPTVVVVMERPEPAWADAARSAARILAEGARIEVVGVPAGGIDRTSSGKPRRRRLWQAYRAGELNPATAH